MINLETVDLKLKCVTCSGKKCIHVNVYLDNIEKKNKNIAMETNDLPGTKLTATKNLSKIR